MSSALGTLEREGSPEVGGPTCNNRFIGRCFVTFTVSSAAGTILVTTLAYAGVGKLYRRGEATEQRGSLFGSARVLFTLAIVEILLSGWLLVPGQHPRAAIVSFALFASFTIYVAANARRRQTVFCSCFGGARYIGPFAVARNIALTSFSLVLLRDTSAWPIHLSQVPTALLAVALPWIFVLRLFDEADGMFLRLRPA